ncbi:MAG: PQQ-dependent sugar dehydrogenase [Gammaproteobacteria bacterium]|nr:PQQ-dependent sugar dehydrogenase [Gammaproteobacteria bacterium]
MRSRTLAATFLALTFNLAQAEDHQLTPIASGLDHPWCIAFLPGGGYLVTELGGSLREVSQSGEIGDPIAGGPEVYHRSQGGLFDVLLHPDFSENQTLFLSYAVPPARDNATQILRAKYVDGALTSPQVIFTVTPRKPTPVHYGGRMVFLDDDTLLLTTGDGFDFREQSQDLASGLGKVMRIHIDGSVPDDNPFVNTEGALASIFTYGHRNPQGLVVASDGRVYLHEHGPRGGDETNLLIAGANYGWPAVTFGREYSGGTISPFTEGPGFEPPLHHWTPSIAPSGLAMYEGERFPDWQGDLLVGALVDKEVRRLDLEDGVIVNEEALFSDLDRRIRDVRAHDGYIYLVEDGADATIWRVEPKKTS